MQQEQLQELKDHVAETIKVVVNGKIDRLNLKLDNYIDNDEKWKKEDFKWKERAEPLVKAYENTGWLWKVFLKVLKFIVLLGAAVGAYIVIKDKI